MRPHYPSLEARLLSGSVMDERGCWIWIRNVCRKGYGRINMVLSGKHTSLRAHRVSYECFMEPIPDGYQLDHTCREVRCINPMHLQPVPPDVNRARQTEAHRRGKPK